MKRIYLCGGFRSGWQDKVIKILSDKYDFFDPRNGSSPYTFTDLDGIKNSNIILAYLEEDNPGGYAGAFEMGYAYALGKTIILISEKDHTKMLKDVSLSFNTLMEAIEYLNI